jgi:25S rRNA (uracil2634-N3)-methyltransferase
LLVSFFKNVTPSLSPTPGSSIIVTLFEGEPYTLWNIRDLARHSGLEVKQSFRFQATAYPGYKHARTLGVVKGRNGEVGAGWKGEERTARSYEFVRKGEGAVMGVGKKGKEISEDEEDGDIEDGSVDSGLEIQDEDDHEEDTETEDDDEDEDGG